MGTCGGSSPPSTPACLDGEDRATIEAAFKRPTGPDAPNVLACTPTLELGIDIGDLSLVTLTSLPRSTAAYLQRVGRAGRQTGSALVVCVLPSRALELHHLADPLTMIAGRVRPPACHLDAVEIIRRQFLAHLIDRWAATGRVGRGRIRDYLQHGVEPGSWFGDLLAPLRTDAKARVGEFLDLFGGEIGEATAADLLALRLAGPGRRTVRAGTAGRRRVPSAGRRPSPSCVDGALPCSPSWPGWRPSENRRTTR